MQLRPRTSWNALNPTGDLFSNFISIVFVRLLNMNIVKRLNMIGIYPSY